MNYRILSTGFEPCPFCGHKHIKAILEPGNHIELPPDYSQWWYVHIQCKNAKCGARIKRSKCLPKKANVIKWFKSQRKWYNKRSK